MIIIRTVKELREYVAEQRHNGKSIGLVPTMGALHAGHISLMEKAVAADDVVVSSVFVNPTQFNNPTDLATYPRKEEDDFKLLENAGVAAVFAPSVQEVYPDGCDEEHVFDLGQVSEVMEGKFRPGHFQGVAQIVSKLFRFVEPDHAYFGEKDFQQIAVIRRMVATEGINVEIIACPIKRGADGLALSSRNSLLTSEQRAIAPGIYGTLKESLDYSLNHTVTETHDFVVDKINALNECEVEYFEIVDGLSLQSVNNWDDSKFIVGCITVYCGKVRLIDNITYRRP
jgi:pantoate--beta-alanine ligase